ncbi:hypothetical protein [Rhizobium jaguaris]|uniref:Uncharacterized protein n=1 Tax=Rhizobium jaguaris TaxID=1312183 RepID=A0A387G1M7_9HYPH|nr:hypothetical protein [Rhizobium jaguaris]AYG64438.1 hypothetical protein CCGE525_37525 [Rhizobium jaguaris]
MSRLHYFFHLSAQRDDIEARLLAQEYRMLLLEDHVDDGTSSELQSKCTELSREIYSYRHRRHR